MTTLETTLRVMITDAVRDAVREVLSAEGRKTTSGSAEFLTYADAAGRLSISVSTLKRWVRAGRLRACGSGKVRRVRAADVDALLADPMVTPAQGLDEAPAARAQAILATLPRRSR